MFNLILTVHLIQCKYKKQQNNHKKICIQMYLNSYYNYELNCSKEYSRINSKLSLTA